MSPTSRQRLATLVHDVGKYVARTARNLPDDPPAALVAMLVRDLYQLRAGQRASAVFAALSEALPLPGLDGIAALFVELDALEPEVRAGHAAAVARAATLACAVEERLRALLREAE